MFNNDNNEKYFYAFSMGEKEPSTPELPKCPYCQTIERKPMVFIITKKKKNKGRLGIGIHFDCMIEKIGDLYIEKHGDFIPVKEGL